MRLLDTHTCQFVEKDSTAPETVYAILSHTWDKDSEQTYEELRDIQLRYVPEISAPQRCSNMAEVPTDSPASVKLTALSHLTKSKVEALFQMFVKKDALPNTVQSVPNVPEGIASSGEQITGRPSPTSPLSQPHVSNGQPVIAPPIPQSTRSKSCFTRGITRLRQHSSARNNTPHVPSDSPSETAPPMTAPVLHTSPEGQSTPLWPIWKDPKLSSKIREACRIARENGYSYIWIDSCCIDKSSSSELSDAINSMYNWYGRAAVCYAYLADVAPGEDHHAVDSRFRRSKWFKRGWTLQELIAPFWVEFLAKDWSPCGSKHTLSTLVESITKIHSTALLKSKSLDEFSVAQRLSWAATRDTKKKEDRAYSLLGIFDINMPTIYGEGDRAFRRLQEQIMFHIPDHSIFAWGNVYPHGSLLPQTPAHSRKSEPITLEAVRGYLGFESLLAQHLMKFQYSSDVKLPSEASHHHRIKFTLTPYGIYTELHMTPVTPHVWSRILGHINVQLELPGPEYQWYLAILECEHENYPSHLLGRVYAIRPSESLAHTGRIKPSSRSQYPYYDLFLLSEDTVKYLRPKSQVMPVYIPHPDRIALPLDRPCHAIKLELLKETLETGDSQGCSAKLQLYNPSNPYYPPNTHWLTLSKGEHRTIVEFKYQITEAGKCFTIDAKVKTLGSRGQLHCSMNSDQVDHHTISWIDSSPWSPRPTLKTGQSSTIRVGVLTVDLSLQFAGTGFYIVHTNVRSNTAPASTSTSKLDKSTWWTAFFLAILYSDTKPDKSFSWNQFLVHLGVVILIFCIFALLMMN